MGRSSDKSGSNVELDNRIVRYYEADPAELAANPHNWRKHPPQQASALAEVLERYGWIAPVIYNRTTGRLIDGHLRTELARMRGARVPVVEVELSEDEERQLIAVFDPLSGIADVDYAILRPLAEELAITLPDVFEAIRPALRMDVHDDKTAVGDATTDPDSYFVVVIVDSEQEQRRLLDRLIGEGYKCRAFL